MQIAPTRLSLDFEHIFMSSIGGCCSGLEFPLDMYPTFLDEVTVFQISKPIMPKPETVSF